MIKIQNHYNVIDPTQFKCLSYSQKICFVDSPVTLYQHHSETNAELHMRQKNKTTTARFCIWIKGIKMTSTA
jgi:hypothetical protein